MTTAHSLCRDPHWNIGGPYGPEFKKYKSENNKHYRKLLDIGIEFRGYRFWPPFFCFYCGRAISTDQWLFSRCCGGCDSSLGLARHGLTGRRLFAGKVRIEESTRNDYLSIVEETESRGGFLDPRVEPGKSQAARAQSYRAARALRIHGLIMG